MATQPCRNFPCSFACDFLHREGQQVKETTQKVKKPEQQDNVVAELSKLSLTSQPQQMAVKKYICRFGKICRNRNSGCSFEHQCKFGKKCTNEKCSLDHQCPHGQKCRYNRDGTCRNIHSPDSRQDNCDDSIQESEVPST